MSETATFCAVCGARFDGGAPPEPVVAGSAPVANEMSAPVAPEPTAPVATDEAAEPDRWDTAERHEETPALVADLTDEPVAHDGPDLEADTGAQSHSTTAAPELDDGPGAEEEGEPQAETEAVPETLEPDETEAEAQAANEDPEVRRLAEATALLEEAAGSEETDTGRAAALYRDAILACLDAAEDPLGSEDVHALLLRSFAGLSSLLERRGMPEEALSVVEEAASLGLLNGGRQSAAEPREALRDRRESLRRILFADSAQL